ncbi:MAG: hypothetical protein Q4C87_06180 [Actinomycetaceae bacterium]|nr:hypothetical protein [Actinomycetaceae bacterium]
MIGLAYLLDATWKWREKKYVKSGFSLIGGALVIALCVHLSGIALSSLLSSVPDVFAAPKTTDTAQCLSSATERGVDGEGHRNASPRREYTQYHFVIVDGNSEPFDVYLTAYDDEGDNPVIRTIQRHCGSKETFTLVYYPGSKTVVEAR